MLYGHSWPKQHAKYLPPKQASWQFLATSGGTVLEWAERAFLLTAIVLSLFYILSYSMTSYHIHCFIS